MDLIYTNTRYEDVGVLDGYTFDLAFGSDENDFELSLDSKSHCCEAGCLLYIEGTEYGGVIDKINVLTKDDKLTYKGRTWHGILGSKVIQPDAGKAYLTVTGNANTILDSLIDRLGLSDLFTVSKENSEVAIDRYSFDRYVDAYTGITKMLATASGKLKFTFTNGKVVLSAASAVDYSKDEQFDNDSVEMEIEKAYNPVNHLICLGKGELADRTVVHLYRDKYGNITDAQSLFGLQEVMGVYDYPNVESAEELKKSGKEKLESEKTSDKVQMNFAAEETTYDVGDIIGAKEVVTGTYVTQKITKKIVTISEGVVNIEYKVGE